MNSQTMNFSSRIARGLAIGGFLVTALLLDLTAVQAQCLDEDLTKILAIEGSINDHMGQAVAIHDDLAVFGAPDDDESPLMSTGSVYVFRRNDLGQWEQEARLTAPEPTASSTFGRSVDVHGDRVIVGSLENFDGVNQAGAVYIFRYNPDGPTWEEEQRIVLATPEPGDHFGNAVGLGNGVAVIGAENRTVDTEDYAGAAYVYEFFGGVWSSAATLEAPNASEDAFFGHSVAIDGNWIIAGAWTDNTNHTDAGAAYLFTDLGGAWNYHQTVIPITLAEDDLFGAAVDIDGDRAVVSAHHHDPQGENRGAAYVFELEPVAANWVEVAELTAGDAEAFDRFGLDVAIEGDAVLVGSYDDVPGDLSGAAYLFRFDGFDWVEQTKIEPLDLMPEDYFGRALDLDGEVAVIASPLNDGAVSGAGAGYIYEVPDLSLDIEQEIVIVDQFIDFQVCGVAPGNIISLQIVDGAVVVHNTTVASDAAMPDGTWADSYQVPPIYAGETLEFEAWSHRLDVRIGSNRESVDVDP